MIAVAVGAIGCGGDAPGSDPSDATSQATTPAGSATSTPTTADTATFKALVASSAVVQGAMEPLYLCLPDEISCLKKGASGVAEIISEERSKLDEIIGDTDDPCIARVAASFEESIQAYEAAARAAEEGNGRVFERELARSTEAEKRYVAQWSRCGFFDGEQSQFITYFGNAFFGVIDASEGLLDCATRRCIERGARKMEEAAEAGFELLDEASTEIAEGPECLQESMKNARLTFGALQEAARSIQEDRLRKAQQQADRGARFATRTQDLFASCTQELFQE